jgi:hypothetical protein
MALFIIVQYGQDMEAVFALLCPRRCVLVLYRGIFCQIQKSPRGAGYSLVASELI